MSSTNDVEMKDAPSDAKPDVSLAQDSPEETTLVQQLEVSFGLLQKAAANFDNRYVSKVFRELGPLRRKLAADPSALVAVISAKYPDDQLGKTTLLGNLPSETCPSTESNEHREVVSPEINAYVHLLVQLYLLDVGKLDELASFNNSVISLLQAHERRILDFIQAKLWFYIARTSELRGDLLAPRPVLLNALRGASLRHHDETTACLITLLFRNYLLCHDIGQAANLSEKITFPANAGNALTARYYYYLSRISTVQLDYSTAHECVIAAIRKAPQTNLAKGFIQEATKLNIIIELLMGDIPELSVFKIGSGNLEPYFEITKAVRHGDLKAFEEALKKYEQEFVQDNNYTLVSRLHQNVIKTGIRMISLSYSKISLKEVCIKLHLDSEEATEYIVSKAIRDGVIEATVDHEHGIMKSKELLDVYSTKQPQEAFDQRIRFCLALHTDSVKAMRYPSEDHKNEVNKGPLDGLEDEMDLLQAIEDGDLDDFMD